MLPGFYYGTKTITMPRFDPGVLISTFKENKVSFFQAVPLLFKFIASIDLITEEDLKSIHSFVSGGYPLSRDIFHAMKRKAPHAIFQEGYGMTETLSTHGVPYTKENIGYCGQLLQDVKAKVVDVETREPLPPNTPGELIIHTPAEIL
ncbi:4-coumarate--CoA ligase 1 [Armadillidium nasatum]|uniref:4-coumarate--CoA ligase 1 n=1 Tax=Armadillidium nasatum TaxID=96803 RepID=A0A5N5T1Q2_9CRUS|nr:4-coumarate--CoA ligase 1 [Armadillidium nasatum]